MTLPAAKVHYLPQTQMCFTHSVSFTNLHIAQFFKTYNKCIFSSSWTERCIQEKGNISIMFHNQCMCLYQVKKISLFNQVSSIFNIHQRKFINRLRDNLKIILCIWHFCHTLTTAMQNFKTGPFQSFLFFFFNQC